MTPTLTVVFCVTLAAPISAIANHSGAEVEAATAAGDRSNRRPLRGYAE